MPRIRSAGREGVGAKTDLADAPAGTELFDVQEKLFPDIKAEEGESAYTFMHTVPYEGSVGLVNLLTTTPLVRKGFKTNLILYGPGVLMASGTRGFPKVGDEAVPGPPASRGWATRRSRAPWRSTISAARSSRRAGRSTPAGSRAARCTASRR